MESVKCPRCGSVAPSILRPKLCMEHMAIVTRVVQYCEACGHSWRPGEP